MIDLTAQWVFTVLVIYATGALCVVLTLVAFWLIRVLEDD